MNSWTKYVLGFCLCAFFSHAWASPPAAEFALEFGQVDTEYLFENNNLISLEMNSGGVMYREAMTSRLSGAIHLGFNDNTSEIGGQSNSLEGHYGGIDLKLNLVDSPLNEIALYADYQYTRMEESETDLYRLEWHQWQGGLKLRLNSIGLLGAQASAAYVGARGKQKFPNNPNINRFDHSEDNLYTFSLIYNIDSTGSIAFEGLWGQYEGVALTFKRSYL